MIFWPFFVVRFVSFLLFHFSFFSVVSFVLLVSFHFAVSSFIRCPTLGVECGEKWKLEVFFLSFTSVI